MAKVTSPSDLSSNVSRSSALNDGATSSSSVNLRSTRGITLEDLRQWEVFKGASDLKLRNVQAIYSFNLPPFKGCLGGAAIIFFTARDEAYGYGHNCFNINMLGYPQTHQSYRRECITKPLKISGLSNRGIQQMSIGGLIGAAVTASGTLLWWGHCHNSDDSSCSIMTPHRPQFPRRRFLSVSCGYRIMAAIDLSGNVFVWGQLKHNATSYLEGERLVIDFPASLISCGANHLAMMDANGFVYTWGSGSHGQRGLIDYTSKYDYDVTVISQDQCVDIKCGPYSTFCLTASHELKACGSNGRHHLGHLPHFRDSNTVTTLKKISLFGPVAHISVIWNGNYTATMAAQVTNGEVVDLYTWGAGSTAFPKYSGKNFLFEVFSSLNLTPGLERVRILEHSEELERSMHIHNHRSQLVSDCLNYIYLRDREEFSREASRFLWKCKNHRLINTVNLMPCEVSGRAFIFSKFVKDLDSVSQMLPHAEENIPEYEYSSEENDEFFADFY